MAAHHLRAENGGTSLRMLGFTVLESRRLLAHGLNQGPGLADDPLDMGRGTLRQRSRSPPRKDGRHGLCRHPCTICNARWCNQEVGHRIMPYPQHCCPHCRALGATAYQSVAPSGTSSSSSEMPAPQPIGARPSVCQVCIEPIWPYEATRRCYYVATSVGRHCGGTVHRACFRSSHDQCLNCRVQDADEDEEL